jgi:hypothetical protein
VYIQICSLSGDRLLSVLMSCTSVKRANLASCKGLNETDRREGNRMLLEMLFQHVLPEQSVMRLVHCCLLHSTWNDTVHYFTPSPASCSTCSRQCKAAPLYYWYPVLLRYSRVRRLPPSATPAPHSPSRVTSHPAQSPVPQNPNHPQNQAPPLLLPQLRPL